MKALIFTEGGEKIGFGHMTRCSALRDALNLKGVQTKMIVNGDSSVKRFSVKPDLVFNWLSNRSRTNKLLKKADIIVIDSYLAPLEFYKKASKTAPVCVYVDDFLRLRYPEGIVTNGTVGAEHFCYPKNKAHFLGTKYALLRPSFWSLPKRKPIRKIKNVLITFGGMKRTDFINALLTYLRPRFPNLKFHVIVAKKDGLKRFKKVAYYASINAEKIKELMLHSDIAISGGGQTTNELAACGVPIFGISLADNQRLNIKGWERNGILKYTGHLKDKSLFKKTGTLLSNRKNLEAMSANGQRLVDGKGALRLADQILDSGFDFEKITIKDRRQIFKWANLPEVRSVSLNSKPIRWREHCEWFRWKLKSQDCLFFKMTWFHRPIGQIRFDRNGKKLATISIALDRKFRGRGLGARGIRLALERVFQTKPNIQMIDALVKKSNLASEAAFVKAGFKCSGIKNIKGQKVYRFTKRKS